MNANIGIRAHDVENLPLEQLVTEIASKEVSAVQLALSKSFKEINREVGCLTPSLAHNIGVAFQKGAIQIAVLGCYINMIHPNLKERRKELDLFKEHIRYCRDLGCSLVGTETGNVNAEIVYTEENFKEEPFLEVVESVRELVKEAEKFGVMVAIEGGINHPIHSPKRMKRLLDEVKSNNLQVIFDPANYLTIDNYQKQVEIFQEAFDLFGDQIVIIHAKDFIIDNKKIKFVPVGHGMLDYEAIFRLIKGKKPFINIILEETKDPYIKESIQYLNRLFSESIFSI
ncbi:sugar phosphate isomerase/epimerase family protein [Niallia sp.]|uniref:sugar phosphate isomerase/epimerase family protein n=1 Tax=Niallia sp. TaxID=2837523 RepID=UPI00289D8E99|nr:sugar phosphate isomerase/epimerase family protein [Niallia sp.]